MTARSRVLCTVAAGHHRDLWEIARPKTEEYAARHGYHLVAVTTIPELGGRPPAWAKVPLVRDLLTRHDTVVWIDADAIIVDPTDDIAADATSRRPLHLVSHRIDGAVVPNLGVFVIHRSRQALRLLTAMWQRTELVHHRWWDNAALIDALGGDPDRGLVGRRQRLGARRWVGELPGRWNSLPEAPAPRPAIVHFAGTPHAERLAGMSELAARPPSSLGDAVGDAAAS